MNRFHVVHFMTLAVILGAGAYTFLSLSGNQTMQMVVGLLTALLYVAWGITHHYIQKDLHPKVVVEYSLIGLVAILLLLVVFGS